MGDNIYSNLYNLSTDYRTSYYTSAYADLYNNNEWRINYNDICKYINMPKEDTIEDIFNSPENKLQDTWYRRISTDKSGLYNINEVIHVTEFNLSENEIQDSHVKMVFHTITPFCNGCYAVETSEMSLKEFKIIIEDGGYKLTKYSYAQSILLEVAVKRTNYKSFVIKCGNSFLPLALEYYGQLNKIGIGLGGWWSTTTRDMLLNDKYIAILKPNGGFFFLPSDMYDEVIKYHKVFNFSFTQESLSVNDLVQFFLRAFKEEDIREYNYHTKAFTAYIRNYKKETTLQEYVSVKLGGDKQPIHEFQLQELNRVITKLSDNFGREFTWNSSLIKKIWGKVGMKIKSQKFLYEIK